jgi:hypothetical protein
MQMLKPFEYEGIWWLPDKPEEKIEGTLRFDPSKGAKLELKEISNIEEVSVILGCSLSPISGIEFTLLHCYNQARDLLGVVPPEFYVKYVFMGVHSHFDKKENIKFRNISIQYLYLDDWANIQVFDIDFKSEGNMVIKYSKFKSIPVNIDEKLKIAVNAGVDSSLSRKEINLKKRAEIKIEPSEEEPFEYYLDIIDKIQKFLTLAVLKPVDPVEIKGTTELHKEERIGQTDYLPIEVYYKIPNIPNLPEEISPDNMLFTLKDIPSTDRLGELLKNWFERTKTKELKPIYESYFKILYNPSSYFEHRCFSFVAAIEGYHQRNFSGKETLKERLDKLFEKYQVILNELTEEELERLKIKDKNEFTCKVKDVRNYLAHFNEEKERKVSDVDLYLLTRKLELLIHAILLEEIGFDLSKIEELLKREIQQDRNKTVIIKN